MNLKQTKMRHPQNAKNKNSIIDLLLKLKNTSLWVILLFLTQSILYAQTPYGSITGHNSSTYIINKDNSNHRAVLRLQNQGSAWLLEHNADRLEFKWADHNNHFGYGESRVRIKSNGEMDVDGEIQAGGIYSRGNLSFRNYSGRGIRFWDSDKYKIHMGKGDNYTYGPVTDYAIKMNMSDDDSRGWVWGVLNQAPIAALNNEGNMKLNGNIDVASLTVGTDKKINGALAHFDGRVYISEENGTEEGFGSTTTDNYKDYLLWVEEGIVSTDFALAELTEWPDYVFYNDYKLPSLANVEKNIKDNGHLHTMPSAKEVEENGFTVKDMTKRVVKTIEELTLHTIAQEKQIEAQNKLIEKLSKRLEKLEQANK